MPYITEIHFLKDYMMDMKLSNGHKILYDLKPCLITARFRDLEDQDVYAGGRLINGIVIWWNGNTELSLDEILYTVTHTKEDEEIQTG